jgi:hypothetical protein
MLSACRVITLRIPSERYGVKQITATGSVPARVQQGALKLFF